jgi:hypothetical protein
LDCAFKQAIIGMHVEMYKVISGSVLSCYTVHCFL